MKRDLKVKLIPYGIGSNTREVEAAVNFFMAAVMVEKVEVVSVFSTTIIHIFYYGEDPTIEAEE